MQGRNRKRATKFLVITIAILFLVATGITGLLYVQGRVPPHRTSQYVALGSSFAAGIGLGERAAGSPYVCLRRTGGYPSLAARELNVSLEDVSCSGSTTRHVLEGGQMYQGPQLEAVGAAARIVSVTSGGNDVGYIADLMKASGKGGIVGGWLSGTTVPVGQRDFGAVSRNLVAIAAEARRRAPHAKIVFVLYPRLVPPRGTCDRLGISAEEAALSRDVAARLARATKVAAQQSGALLVDMDALSRGHDACSAAPWVNGASPAEGTAFHPNRAGARATAEAIVRTLATTGPIPAG